VNKEVSCLTETAGPCTSIRRRCRLRTAAAAATLYSVRRPSRRIHRTEARAASGDSVASARSRRVRKGRPSQGCSSSPRCLRWGGVVQEILGSDKAGLIRYIWNKLYKTELHRAAAFNAIYVVKSWSRNLGPRGLMPLTGRDGHRSGTQQRQVPSMHCEF
jgi:hypothetical protein